MRFERLGLLSAGDTLCFSVLRYALTARKKKRIIILRFLVLLLPFTVANHWVGFGERRPAFLDIVPRVSDFPGEGQARLANAGPGGLRSARGGAKRMAQEGGMR